MGSIPTTRTKELTFAHLPGENCAFLLFEITKSILAPVELDVSSPLLALLAEVDTFDARFVVALDLSGLCYLCQFSENKVFQAEVRVITVLEVDQVLWIVTVDDVPNHPCRAVGLALDPNLVLGDLSPGVLTIPYIPCMGAWKV